ncbi:MAG: M28 family peptidase [Armatimonadetes bacterium]|nr:M28 family peptidase [Armatimonadota bacterium]
MSELFTALRDVERRIVEAVSGKRLLDHTAAIARYVRLTGTPEEDRAFRDVQARLEALGVSTKLLHHDAYVSLPVEAALDVIAPESRKIECYTTSFSITTPAEGIEGELVYCGEGHAADFEGKDLRGKVLLFDGLPSPSKAMDADRHGAAGHLHAGDDHLHWMIISPVWGSPTPDRVPLMPKSAAACIRRGDGAWLRERLAKGAVRVRLRTKADTGWRKTPLLVADIPGQTKDFILFSGHLDSWDHGAMDNGTANAAMIELAGLLNAECAHLRRGIRLCFWSGHSHGRYSGSAWYVDHHWEALHEHCVAHVNIDSVGGKGANVLVDPTLMAETKPLAAAAIREHAGQELIGKRIGRMGDHSLVGVGVASMFMSISHQPPHDDATSRALAVRLGGKVLSGGLGWWWHTAQDTLDKIDEDNFIRDTRVYATVLFRLAAAPVLPLDLREHAAEWVQILEDLAKVAGGRFDLEQLETRARKLESLAVALHRRADTLARDAATGHEDEAGIATVNACIQAVCRTLVPVSYTRSGAFDHDLALPATPLGALDDVRKLAKTKSGSDDAKFLETALVRARNRAAHALAKAIRQVEVTLEGLHA